MSRIEPPRGRIRALVLFLTSLCLAGIAFGEPPTIPDGPLGATPRQIIALYGPVMRHNARVRHHQILEGGTVIDGDLHSRNGLVVRVVYHGGVAVLLEYTRAAGVLAAKELDSLLAATSGTSTWLPGKDSTDSNRFFHRADGHAVGHYTTDDDGSLLIASEEFGADFYRGNLMGDH